jgi:hypothetical protein
MKEALMTILLLLGFSIRRWFWGVQEELSGYLHNMGLTEWAIVSVLAVTFGFFCMRSINPHG